MKETTFPPAWMSSFGCVRRTTGGRGVTTNREVVGGGVENEDSESEFDCHGDGD